MDDVYGNIKECNQNKKRKILILFDYMIIYMLSNKTSTNSNIIIY